MTDWSRSVIEESVKLAENLRGSRHDFGYDMKEAAKWLRNRVEHDWYESRKPGFEKYDSSVRELARAALELADRRFGV